MALDVQPSGEPFVHWQAADATNCCLWSVGFECGLMLFVHCQPCLHVAVYPVNWCIWAVLDVFVGIIGFSCHWLLSVSDRPRVCVTTFCAVHNRCSWLLFVVCDIQVKLMALYAIIWFGFRSLSGCAKQTVDETFKARWVSFASLCTNLITYSLF